MVTIREAAAEDLGRIHQLNQANVPHVGAVDAERCAQLMAMADLALVVEADGPDGTVDLAGFCFVMGPGRDYDSVNYTWCMARFDDAFYLDRVVIDAPFRGHGVGRALYAAVEERIRIGWPSIARLTLEVNLDPPNPESLAFHDRLGFVEVGRQFTPYGAEVSLMAKPLRAVAGR